MKTTILAFSLAFSLSAPALADDAFWPFDPKTGTAFNGGGIDAKTAAEHKAHHTNLRNGIIANGGCNADLQPVWVAQGCGNGIFNNADATGDSGGNSSSGSGAGGASK